MSEERTKFIYWYAESMGKDEACAAHVWDNNHGIALAWRAAAPAQPVAPSPDAAFEMWWADHAPNSARKDAWAEWCALWPSQPAAQAAPVVAVVQRDAERYQWLRNNRNWRVTYRIRPGKAIEYAMVDECDRWGPWWPTHEQAIDAARAGQGGAA